MFSYTKSISLVLLISIGYLLAACGGGSSPEKQTNPKYSICDYTEQSMKYIKKTGSVLESTKPNISSGKSLRSQINELNELLSEFGQIQAPPGTETLQSLTAGTISSANKLLKAFENGGAGEREASIHLKLLESATKEIQRLRKENGCR